MRYYEAMGWDFTKESFDNISIEFMAIMMHCSIVHHSIKTLLKPLNISKTQGYKQIVVSALEHNRLKRITFDSWT